MRIKQQQLDANLFKNLPEPWLAGSVGWGSSCTQKVVSSVSQGTSLGCVFDPRLGCIQGEATDLYSLSPSPDLSLYNQQIYS